MKDVSIVIINYNTFRLTCDCIKSILKQQVAVDYEIILVDNASTEQDPDKFTELFPSVKLIKSDKNLGFSKGNNLGIKYASGHTILLLNSDTELVSDSITLGFETLNRNQKIGVVTGQLVSPDGSIQNNCQSFPSLTKKLVENFRLQKIMPVALKSRYLKGHYFDYSTPGKPDWVWGTFFMFRKDLLSTFENNKLPETYFMYLEDMEWCYEIRKKGFDIVYIPEIRVLHHLGGSGANAKRLIRENFNDFLNRNYLWPKSALLKNRDQKNLNDE
ncbi:MAG: glycosyltransferase family 2 protein [Brumimicrobium sp.]|nr:glycosyltransferase family 2 protein [Brumimicrobium sp.]